LKVSLENNAIFIVNVVSIFATAPPQSSADYGFCFRDELKTPTVSNFWSTSPALIATVIYAIGIIATVI
jgi:hypothetical protein